MFAPAGKGRSKWRSQTGINPSVGAWTVAGISGVGAGLTGADMWQPHSVFPQQLCFCGKQHDSTGAGRLALNTNVSSAVKTVTAAFIGIQRRLALGRCQDGAAVLSMNVMRWGSILFLAFAAAAFGEDNVIHLSSKPAPSFTLKNLDKVDVASTNFAGQTRLVCFWASWDKPSQQQLSIFRDIQRQYGASNLTVLALALDAQNADAIKAFFATNSIAFPVLVADFTVIKDFGGLEAIPTSILIEPHGLIVSRFVGLAEKAAITNLLEAIRNSQR